MSVASFFFDPIRAAIARAMTSSNPIAKATGAAANDALAKVAVDVSQPSLSHNSVVGVGNAIVGDLETGLKGVVDSFIYASITTAIPVVGAPIAQEAVKLANLTIDFSEQHALTYVSALFAHHRATVNTPPAA